MCTQTPRSIVKFFLSVVLSFAVCISVSADDSANDIYSAYCDALISWKNDFAAYMSGASVGEDGLFTVSEVIYNKAETQNVENDIISFFLRDLNGDDIPELFICDYEPGDDVECRIFEIFSWDNTAGQVLNITPEYLEMYLLSDGQILVRNGRGSATYELYAYYGGGSLTLVDAYEHAYRNGDDERTYYHCGADYSLSEQMTDDEMCAMIESHGLVTFTCIPATAENLTKLRDGVTTEYEDGNRYSERVFEMELVAPDPEGDSLTDGSTAVERPDNHTIEEFAGMFGLLKRDCEMSVHFGDESVFSYGYACDEDYTLENFSGTAEWSLDDEGCVNQVLWTYYGSDMEIYGLFTYAKLELGESYVDMGEDTLCWFLPDKTIEITIHEPPVTVRVTRYGY